MERRAALLARAVGRLALGSAAQALAGWRASVGGVVRRRNRARKVLLRLRRDAEARSLASWRARVAERRRQRTAMGRAVAKLLQLGVARAFARWREVHRRVAGCRWILQVEPALISYPAAQLFVQPVRK
jgi:hypothetical protein